MLHPSTSAARRAPPAPEPSGCVVHPPVFFRDEEAFLEALRQRHAGAVGFVFDRYHRRIDRTLCAVLGFDADIPDLVQEVFTRALSGLPRFRGNLQQLEPWLTRIAVYTARGHIRRRSTARRWTSKDAAEPAAIPDHQASPEVVEALRRVYTMIERLPLRERLPFVLRYMDQMKLEEVADACEISLATAKRRLQRARERLEQYATGDPLLASWLAPRSGS